MEDNKKMLIVDCNALLYRAFHALPPLSNKEGEQTGASYGFLLTLFRAIKDLKPNFLVACFDFPAPTFRHKEFKDYKAQRPKMPDDLSYQIPKTKKLLKSFEIPIFEKKGFEADDLVATISKLTLDKKEDIEVYIITGDLDLLQLIDNNIKVYALGRGIKQTVIYNKDKVLSKFSVPPKDLVDLKALAGDPSDNIPGIPGIGKKTAAKLLNKFDNLDNLYQNIDKKGVDVSPRIKTKLKQNKQKALLSRKLVRVKKDVPINFNLKECQFQKIGTQKSKKALKNLGFHSLLNKLPESRASQQQKLLSEK